MSCERIVLATVVLLVGITASGVAFAQAPPPARAPTPAPSTSTAPPPSTATRVETWTKKQWEAAQKEWAKDKAKWADCRKRSKAQKLSGRKSWSFLYQCMTG